MSAVTAVLCRAGYQCDSQLQRPLAFQRHVDLTYALMTVSDENIRYVVVLLLTYFHVFVCVTSRLSDDHS